MEVVSQEGTAGFSRLPLDLVPHLCLRLERRAPPEGGTLRVPGRQGKANRLGVCVCGCRRLGDLWLIEKT